MFAPLEDRSLAETARRLWWLDQTPGAAHEECARLACERERAIQGLEDTARAGLRYRD